MGSEREKGKKGSICAEPSVWRRPLLLILRSGYKEEEGGDGSWVGFGRGALGCLFKEKPQSRTVMGYEPCPTWGPFGRLCGGKRMGL